MKKKILILIPSLEFGGGAERFVSLIATRLSKNFQITVLTFFDPPNLYAFKGKYLSLKETIALRKSIYRSFKIYEFIRLFRLYKHICLYSPDIILSFTDFANFPIIITKFLFRIKIPLIITIRCNPKIVYKKSNQHANFLIKRLYNSNLVDKIVLVSNELQDIMEEDYQIRKDKMITLYNGIEIEKIREKKDKVVLDYKEFFKKNTIKFITVGRLHDDKGHEYLIDAFCEVRKEIKSSKLIIIGDGPLKHKLETIIKKKGLENEILLLGLKKNPFKYLVKSDIFVLSSKNEGFPNVLIEALACGLPIISTNCKTGPYEILDRGTYGLLVNVMDSENMAEKMIYLAKNKELRKKYSQKSLIRADFFNFERIFKDWVKLINTILFKS